MTAKVWWNIVFLVGTVIFGFWFVNKQFAIKPLPVEPVPAVYHIVCDDNTTCIEEMMRTGVHEVHHR